MHELPKLTPFPRPGDSVHSFLPLPPSLAGTMHSFDAAASFLSGSSAEGSFKLRQQHHKLVRGAASSSPPRGGTRAGGVSGRGGGFVRCQDCWRRAKADCAHRRCCDCCSGRGLVCPAHVKPSSHVAASQCSEPQHTLAAVALPTRKRPRALPSVATPTTSSSVGQPTATVPERFAREVSLGAVFRRVRLGPDAAEVAYHTSVTIGGRVFRGVLFDAGPHHSRSTASTVTAGSSDDDGSSRSTAAGGLDLTLRL